LSTTAKRAGGKFGYPPLLRPSMIQVMSNLRLIAEKLGKCRVARVPPPEPEPVDFYVSFETLTQYPATSMLCFLAIGGAFALVAVMSVLAFLVVATR
jgi:hypothetical protein